MLDNGYFSNSFKIIDKNYENNDFLKFLLGKLDI